MVRGRSKYDTGLNYTKPEVVLLSRWCKSFSNSSYVIWIRRIHIHVSFSLDINNVKCVCVRACACAFLSIMDIIMHYIMEIIFVRMKYILSRTAIFIQLGVTYCDRWIPSQRPVTQSFDVFFDVRLNTTVELPVIWDAMLSVWRYCHVPSASEMTMKHEVVGHQQRA